MAARNYSEIVEYIKTHPRQAIILIAQWQDFAKKNPILASVQSAEEWYLKAEENNIDPSLWIAREIMDVYPEVRNDYPETRNYLPEKPRYNLSHHANSFMVLPLLPTIFSKPNFMEDDSQYQAIVKRLKSEYKEKLREEREVQNPGQKIKINDADPQLLDYVHGSIDERNTPSFHQDAEKLFREGADIAEKDPVKKTKKLAKRQKEIERYDKIKKRTYRKASSDPFVIRLQEKIAEHTRIRYDLYQRGLGSNQDKKQGQQKLNEIAKTVEDKEWEEFVLKHPEKATKYSQETKGSYGRKIKAAIERNKQRQPQEEAPKQEGIQTTQLFRQIIRNFLSKEQKTAGETRPVQKPSVATRIKRIFVPPRQVPSRTTQESPSKIKQALDRSKTGRVINRTNKLINKYSLSNAKKQARKRINNFLKSLGKKALGKIATTVVPFFFNPVILAISFVIVGTFIILLASYGIIFGGLGINWGDFGGEDTGRVGISKDLDYYIPFKDYTILPKDIKSLILSSWPNAKIENWETIASQSIQNRWNPAFVLALWIEETGAQGAASYSDALGCDPSKPTTDINISLKCLFDSFNSYTNSQFADFMCMYSESKKSPCSFNTNPNFPKNIKYWYSQLVPDGSGALVKFTPTPSTGTAGFSASCPIENPKITNGTFNNPVGGWGHAIVPPYQACTSPPYATCPYSDQLKKSIDVRYSGGKNTNNAPVIMPFLEGQSVTWNKEEGPIMINGGVWGYKFIYSANYNGKKVRLDLTHVNQQFRNLVNSGEQATSVIPDLDGPGQTHLHTAIEVDGKWIDVISEAKMCI